MIARINPIWLRRCIMVLLAIPYSLLLIIVGVLISIADTLADVRADFSAAWK